jgi:hypothetical protein
MNRHNTFRLTFAALMTGLGFGVVESAVAADVTGDRLNNADKEPQNWLMNHRTYDAQRYSPLNKINKDNVKSLKLAYAVAIGGTSATHAVHTVVAQEDFPQLAVRVSAYGGAKFQPQGLDVEGLGRSPRLRPRWACPWRGCGNW